MKTTIDIADPLLEEAKHLAHEQGVTLRPLVEEALGTAVAARRARGEFRLRKASFTGSGLRPELRDGGWQQVRDLAHPSRGA